MGRNIITIPFCSQCQHSCGASAVRKPLGTAYKVNGEKAFLEGKG